MHIDIHPQAKAVIAGLHKDGDKHEKCAILVGQRQDGGYTVTDALPVPNTSDKPAHLYAVTTGNVRKALQAHGYTNDQLVGVAHTHIPGSVVDPSIEDVDALPVGYLGIVYHVRTKTLTCFDHQQGFITKETYVADRV